MGFWARLEASFSRMYDATPRFPRRRVPTRDPPDEAQVQAEWKYHYILPVLFLEYLALSLPRALLPRLMNRAFGNYTYHVQGIVETVKGVLAFVACPVFGRLSDVVGRRTGLLITVSGTTIPILALGMTNSMWVYAVAQGLSGLFASTFTITFAYIADIVAKERRSSAYGLALATFGLSYSLGPIAGGILADRVSQSLVFFCSVALTACALAYIYVVLPESRHIDRNQTKAWFPPTEEYLPNQWSPFSVLEIFSGDPLLLVLSKVVFLYYISVWALLSTIMVHVQRCFHADDVTIGEVLGVFGMCTMFSEGLLVRVLVPYYGERISMQIGLAAFALQCIFITFARGIHDIFFCLIFSFFSNLVYPAVSSLVTRAVAPSKLGEALGALNGIRALTEGFAPLLFGVLMASLQHSRWPGAPYLLAGGFSLAALHMTNRLPEEGQLFEWEKERLRSEGEPEAVGLLSGDPTEDEEEIRDSSSGSQRRVEVTKASSLQVTAPGYEESGNLYTI